MKFLEKVKNMFTEEIEDDDDVKVEKIKSEVKHVEIESPIKKKNDMSEEMISDFAFKTDDIAEKKPIFFDDSDFKDLNIYEEYEEKKPQKMIEKKLEKSELKEAYGNKIRPQREIETKKVFKPTPIISPVYGILDKNYHKEDIISKNESITEKTSREPSIDSIRHKAYGTLEDDLENTLFGSNSILFKKEETKDDTKSELKEVDDVLSELTDDISKELDELLVKKEKYSYSENTEFDEEKSENDSKLDDEDLLGFIDSTLYKDGDDE